MVRLLIHKIDQQNVLLDFSVQKEANQTQTWNYRKRKKMGLVDFGLNNQHLLWKLMKIKRVTEHKKNSYHIPKHFLKLMNKQLRMLVVEN